MWKAKTRVFGLVIDKSNHESIQWEHILVHKSVSEKDPRSTVCSYCNISIWAWTCPSCCQHTIGSVMTNWNPSWPIETVFIHLIFFPQRVLCPSHHAIGIWKIHTSSCYPTYLKKTGPSLALSSQEWCVTISIPAQRVASRRTIKKCTNQLESQLLKESTWYLFRCLVDKRDVEFSILDPFSRSASSKAPMKKPS